ncbi:MAG: hypothetical protein ACI9YE_002659 [Psychroserpens sp.]|jgi:hypothetical protein
MTVLWFKELNKPAADNGTQATNGLKRSIDIPMESIATVK